MNQNVYQDEVIGFVTQAVRYCALFSPESPKKWNSERITGCRRILSALYTAALDLPQLPTDPFASLECVVTEQDYDRVRTLLEGEFGEEDIFLDTEVYDMVYSETPIGISLSELMADLYQYLMDAMWVYREGVESLKEQAIAEINYTFKHEWGTKLLTVLRQLHRIATNSAEEVAPHNESEEWNEEDFI
ncbi:DUF5063 domain-containing protein [Porphyromonas sp.]|uniref:DUF5063 domain-containing protein n=1 Tax=Porphyromonas sp. TaxID=1924944 RepID=UPI0026DA82C4|nr:DUF5063 domain-containing protein [Porphyromonas sp.]MDO4695224.1 DUF5063 domain-containing protein [Porphyromonas sp.]MDO4770974.1 DUF5063 domain-containing protein [Porphyromonas sp.]